MKRRRAGVKSIIKHYESPGPSPPKPRRNDEQAYYYIYIYIYIYKTHAHTHTHNIRKYKPPVLRGDWRPTIGHERSCVYLYIYICIYVYYVHIRRTLSRIFPGTRQPALSGIPFNFRFPTIDRAPHGSGGAIKHSLALPLLPAIHAA